ncbi:MAG: hypothetical protein RLZZ427_1456 [Pseudomonadota bacterium]|jgi:uncharacterized protein YbaP (TraB family)
MGRNGSSIAAGNSFIDGQGLPFYDAEMILTKRLFAATLLPASLALVGLFAPASGFAQQHHPTPQPVERVPLDRVATPALWKVADADTTIYLFGTIHMLPAGIDWYHGKLAMAFDQAGELVTEIPEEPANAAQALLAQHGVLPPGESLRGMLTDAERAKYTAALTGLGLPAAAFDRYKPWYAAVVLATLPLVREGFDPSHGVEAELTERNTALHRPRNGLETLEFQLSLFDQFPAAVQKQYLLEVVNALPTLKQDIGAMIDAWANGDATRLAELMNSEEDSPAMKDALITNRNRAWAAWVRQRLARPGVVFVAVGAGHLGGTGSVQDQLASAGITSQRVQ